MTPFCSSRFSDSNTNLLSQLQITLVDAINMKVHLLDYIVIILDNDMIDYLKFKGQGNGNSLRNLD